MPIPLSFSGTTKSLTFTFISSAGVNVNPSAMTLSIGRWSGTAQQGTTITAQKVDMTALATGIWVYHYTPTALGTFKYQLHTLEPSNYPTVTMINEFEVASGLY